MAAVSRSAPGARPPPGPDAGTAVQMQDGNTSDLLFSIADLIAIISAEVTLDPGDVIVTGTPSGVGVFREPQVFLEPGDLVRVEVERIGSLTNPSPTKTAMRRPDPRRRSSWRSESKKGRDAMTELTSRRRQTGAGERGAEERGRRRTRRRRTRRRSIRPPAPRAMPPSRRPPPSIFESRGRCARWSRPSPNPAPSCAKSPFRARPRRDPDPPRGRVACAARTSTSTAGTRGRQGRMGNFLPRIFGHEMAGRVVAHGPGTGAVPLGTRVAAETHLVDWTCYQCRTGREHVCANLKILGVDADGAFAEYMCLPERNAWPSEGLSPGSGRDPGADGQRRLRHVRGGDHDRQRRDPGLRPDRADGRRDLQVRRRGPRLRHGRDAAPPRDGRAARRRLRDRRRHGRGGGDPPRDRRHGRGRRAGDERRGGGDPPGIPDDHQRRPRSRCWACRPGRSRWTSTTTSSSGASASTASPAASCGAPGTRRRRCCARASTWARSSRTGCR